MSASFFRSNTSINSLEESVANNSITDDSAAFIPQIKSEPVDQQQQTNGIKHRHESDPQQANFEMPSKKKQRTDSGGPLKDEPQTP